MDRRRIWWNGLVECPDGYKYTSPLGTAGMVPPADGSHGTRYDPSRRSFTIVLIPREFSPPKSKQEAGPSERAEEPETNGESRHESRTPTGPHRAPSNLDPHSGNYRAFVKFMDGKKLSEVKLREHLETFGPLGPYLKPSSVNNRNHSAFVEFKTYAGFKAAEAAGLHTLGDVELWVQERDDRESLRNTTRSGSGNGPAMPPPAPGSANRGGRAAGQSLRPSQLTPITTSPQVPNIPNAGGTFPSSRMGAPSPALVGYEAGSRFVSGPSFRGGPGFPPRDRTDSIRTDSGPAARRPPINITDGRRASLFEHLGRRRRISSPPPADPRPRSPLNPDYNHNAQRTDANATNPITAAVPGPLGQSALGQYTSHGDTTHHSVPNGSAVNLPTLQQARSEHPGLQPPTTGFPSNIGSDPEQQTQPPRVPNNTESPNSNSRQQQRHHQPPPTDPPSLHTNGLENDIDAFKAKCSFHSGFSGGDGWCDCDDLFPDCHWPDPCNCPRPSCNPPSSPSAAPVTPAPTTRPPTTRPPLSTEEQPSTDFVIPRRGERRGVDIMTPQGKKKVFKKGGAAGKGEGLGGRTFWDEEGRGAGDGGGKDGGGEGGGGMAA
ncbi:hypothetical protein EG327_001448 [Venturia inaequalis]|uniref:RRM domain-containing protein n=1 Tax=Venturia inaequalis TaxID=5025 RepID=A0A8H3VJP8_VENIN|nr:hypothetical protein EG327_001448 [Venturia inaequalis]